MKKLIATSLAFLVSFNSTAVGLGEDLPAPKGEKPSIKQHSDKQTKTSKPSVWMRMKMKNTTGILTGLAEGDFAVIEENARSMNTFATLERVARGRNESYQLQLKLFRFANKELIRQASDENLDGATMAFMQLTTSCVNCHRMVRDTQNIFTHVIRSDADYYITGPQQAKPPEGKFIKGTQVRIIMTAGSYTKVTSNAGVTAFVATDSLSKIPPK